MELCFSSSAASAAAAVVVRAGPTTGVGRSFGGEAHMLRLVRGVSRRGGGEAWWAVGGGRRAYYSQQAAAAAKETAAADDVVVRDEDVTRAAAHALASPALVEKAQKKRSSSSSSSKSRSTRSTSTAKAPGAMTCGPWLLWHELIPKTAWHVLNRLHFAGHETYLVGGCVRDLYLGRLPKDYDICSQASPNRVKKLFNSAIIVGKRFRVARVNLGSHVFEVTSFNETARLPKSLGSAQSKPPELLPIPRLHIDNRESNNQTLTAAQLLDRQQAWQQYEQQRELVLQANALRRDFTVNGLLYDPFQKTLYDYVGGVKDLHAGTVQTILTPAQSFTEDPARMLRAVRVAARMGFNLRASTSAALKSSSHLISGINSSRLALELESLMSYGAAEQSLKMLYRLDILQPLLPWHQKHLEALDYTKKSSKKRAVLLDLLASLDAVSASHKPIKPALWLAVLALPLGLGDDAKAGKLLFHTLQALVAFVHGRATQEQKSLIAEAGGRAGASDDVGEALLSASELVGKMGPGISAGMPKVALDLASRLLKDLQASIAGDDSAPADQQHGAGKRKHGELEPALGREGQRQRERENGRPHKGRDRHHHDHMLSQLLHEVILNAGAPSKK
eukprot:jgi/Chlat1/1317/Chrsp118S01745